MPNGKDYILFYLKMLLESVDHEGALRFSDSIPYNEQMLSVVTNTNVDVVRAAMKLFAELNMVEVLDDQTIYMHEVEKLVGSEAWSTERSRRCREKKKMLQCNTDATSCNEEIEKETEIKKDIDIKIERERENRTDNLSTNCPQSFPQVSQSIHNPSTDLYTKEQVKHLFLSGDLGDGYVYITSVLIDDLLERLSPSDVVHYINVVAANEKRGNRYTKKTHYQAILEMAQKDRGVEL